MQPTIAILKRVDKNKAESNVNQGLSYKTIKKKGNEVGSPLQRYKIIKPATKSFKKGIGATK